MKVKIKDLEHNPFRNMDKYPVNRDKIEELKNSIEDTGFWGNIVARPHPEIKGKYQLAYGHHRFTTMKEIDETEIEVIIKDLDNSTMLKMMVNDNLDAYNTLPVITLENIRATRDFLNKEINKSKDWKEFKTEINTSLKPVIKIISDSEYPERTFQITKSKGVGRDTIIKYLGKGWEKKSWIVQEALRTIDNPKVDEKAIENLPTMRHVREFNQAIESEDKPITKERQRQYAKEIEKDEISSRDIKNLFSRDKYSMPKKKQEYQKEKIIKYEAYISEIRNKADDLLQDLKKMILTEKELTGILNNPYRKLLLMSLNSLCEQVQLITKKQENEKSKSSNTGIRSLTE